MSRRKKGRAVNGILLLNKAYGLSSNQALQQCKKLYFAQKAGHTGSLDPLATGVLPLCFGEATKFSQYLLNSDNSYKATVKLGQKSSTGDAEGEIIESQPTEHIDSIDVEHCLEQFLGRIEQIPPMYSALKQDGQPLYKLARKGQTVERKRREIIIHSLRLASFTPSDLPEFEIHVTCSKGTYIRTLAEDIAAGLDTVGHLVALERTAVGEFLLSDSIEFSSLQCKIHENDYTALDDLLIEPEQAVNYLPLVELKDGEGYYIKQGQAVFVPNSPLSGLVRIKEINGQFLGIGEILDDGRITPRRLIAN